MSTTLRGATGVSRPASPHDHPLPADGAAPSRGAAIFAEQRRHLFDCVTPLYDEPVAIAEGSGCWVRDFDGREYLDAFAGILTTSLGHCHPAVVAAVREQAARVGHLSTLYVNDRQVEAARALGGIAPGDLDRTFFLNSGTEAIETALATARLHTGRTEIIALRQAYHGRTSMAAALTGNAAWRVLPGTVTGITHALSPYPYRAPFGDALRRGAGRDLRARPGRGHRDLPPTGAPPPSSPRRSRGWAATSSRRRGYFQRMAEIIRSHGGLFIADEVQAGFGRTGGRWFAIEHWDVVPEIMVTAKGIAGGMPVGAVTATAEIAGSWRGKTISTFGGNPVCMAAMVATLGRHARGGREDAGAGAGRAAPRRAGPAGGAPPVDRRGARHGTDAGDRTRRGPRPRRSRRRGWPANCCTRPATRACSSESGGLHGHVIRLGPSLLIEEDEMDEVVARLERACATVEAGR